MSQAWQLDCCDFDGGETHSFGGFHSHGGTPKCLVYFMENPIKIDDLGVPLIQETSKFAGEIAA